jgi:hypothetical protein
MKLKWDSLACLREKKRPTYYMLLERQLKVAGILYIYYFYWKNKVISKRNAHLSKNRSSWQWLSHKIFQNTYLPEIHSPRKAKFKKSKNSSRKV